MIPNTNRRRALSGLILVAVATGVVTALCWYGYVHEPTGGRIGSWGFASVLEMKAWLATAVACLGIVQVVTSAAMWGKIRLLQGLPRLVATVHRWSGTVAFLLILPVAFHCLWSLGYQTYSTRVAVHSALGCAFFGLFSAKMLALRLKGLPGVMLPLLGGGLFGVLAALWATSSLWYFTTLA
jgi:uncharacterized protein DUF6529